MDEQLKSFKIHAFLKRFPTVCHDEVVQCWTVEEADNLGKDAAWDLYFANEGTEDLPSYDDVFDRLRAESYFMSDNDFDMYVDDWYIREIMKNVDFTIEEVAV